AGVERWLNILLSEVRLDISPADFVRLGILARVTTSSNVRNVVAPGRLGTAGKASVVYLTDESKALFRDVADNAIVEGSYPTYGPPPTDDPGEAPLPPAPSPSPTQGLLP
ncbi:MAG: hypothetical protein ABIS18_11580, partial [Actinomycetota bacterium]